MKWEAIKTAPKNRKLLLCLDSKSVAIGNWKKTSDGEMWVNEEYAETYKLWFEPTHWMPLPELPKEEWEWHEPTSESGDLEFWTSATGKMSWVDPNKKQTVSCSQCGRDFGAGEHGFSHCSDHSPKGQCGDCKWAQEKECRYDQVRCCCDESPNAWGDVEASDSCSSFQSNNHPTL